MLKSKDWSKKAKPETCSGCCRRTRRRRRRCWSTSTWQWSCCRSNWSLKKNKTLLVFESQKDRFPIQKRAFNTLHLTWTGYFNVKFKLANKIIVAGYWVGPHETMDQFSFLLISDKHLHQVDQGDVEFLSNLTLWSLFLTKIVSQAPIFMKI